MEDLFSRIVSGLIRIKEIKKALHIIDEMTSNHVFPNISVFTLVFKGLLLENSVMDMRSLYFCMIVKQNIHTNFTFYHVMLVNLARDANKLDVYMILSENSQWDVQMSEKVVQVLYEEGILIQTKCRSCSRILHENGI
ncbi:pentatricopeptide repeat-containing protein [Tanacetum coccineum]